MANPLSNLANNYSIYVWNKRETCLIEYKDCDCFLEYTCLKDDLIEYKFYVLIRILQIYKFPNHDSNKFFY